MGRLNTHVQPTSRRGLGFRGTQVLQYVRAYVAEQGRAPSYGMIRDALGFTGSEHVLRVVARLEERGLLRRAGHGRVCRIRLNGN